MSHSRTIEAFKQDPSEGNAARLIDGFRSTATAGDVAELASALAESGVRLDTTDNVADLASTGGPSSLSTLLCPLMLAESGWRVAKLGIQGRPAGGIDVMARVAGFNIAPASEDIARIINRCGFAHFIAGERFAPLDQRLFQFRQTFGAQNVPTLVAASILSKKLAVGVRLAGLEIRVFRGGNFGETKSEAIENAHMFKAAGRILGVRTVCFITDGSVPYQPYVGRGEALRAMLLLLSGQADEWLSSHAIMCAAMVEEMAGRSLRSDLNSMLISARERFVAHLEAHGARWSSFVEAAERIGRDPKRSFSAPGTGFVRYDVTRIRDLVVPRQGQGEFQDGSGVELIAPPGKKVERGEEILRARLQASSRDLEGFEEAFTLTSTPGCAFKMMVA